MRLFFQWTGSLYDVQQRSLSISIVLKVASYLCLCLCLGLSQDIKAQVPASQGSDNPGAKSSEKAGPEVNSGKRHGDPVIPVPVIPDLSDLEEVVVLATRVEGDGRRRRSAAGRGELDRTDQTSMEDFFDDIDGLSTLGGDDQGNAFSIDGLSADLSNVTLNGQGLGQGGGNGGLGAGDLPPDMIRRVEVYKTPTASLEEGGAGGSVNLQLRNPVEIVKPSTSIKARLSYVPEKDKLSPSANFFSGRSLIGGKFGYMLSLSLADLDREYDSQDISNWVPSDYEGNSVFMPSQVHNSVVEDRRRDAFAGLTLGFRPHRSLDISGSLFLSQKQRAIESQGLQHRIERQRNIDVLASDGRIATKLDSSDPTRKNLRIVGSTREEETDSLVLGVNFNWRRARWRLDGALGYSADNNNFDQPSQSAVFETDSAFGYLVDDDGSLIMSYPEGFPSVEEYDASRVNLSGRKTEDRNRFGGIDATRQLGKRFIRRVSFGGKFGETTRSQRSSKGNETFGNDLTLADFFTGEYQQTPWDTVEWPGAGMQLVDSFVQESPIIWEENLLNDYDIDRQTSAAYLQADFRTSEARKRFLVGNFGVRFVGSDTWIAGFQKIDEVIEPVAIKTTFSDILPSLSMRMRVAERAALSLGAARVMTYPSFNDLAPGIRLNYSEKTARSGNPFLEPFLADQLLAEITWAPARGRRLTGTLVYRDVESYFALGEESVEIADVTYLVTRPVNGEDAYVVTAAILLDQNLGRMTRHLRNLTFSLAYTHNKSNTDMRDPYTGKTLPLPNTAAQVVKVSLNYGKNNFVGKLSYQWRGKSLKASVSESGLSVWNQPVGSLNLNLGWRLNDTLQLTFDARNLLDEEQLRTTDHNTQLWRISERNRSIAITLRAKW